MLNAIFIVLIVGSVVTAACFDAFPQLRAALGPVAPGDADSSAMRAVAAASIDSAKSAVTLAISLVGGMALWLGLMRVVRDAGGLDTLARWLAPVMRRLFPDVPADHPAMGAMILNMASNMLGLGNAATPFGLKAMSELEKLNPHPGVSTNSMALFLAINTSGVAVLPLGVIVLRGTLDSASPGAIVLPSILATMASTIVAISVAKWLQRRPGYSPDRFVDDSAAESESGPTLADGIRGLDEAEQVAEIRTESSRWRSLVTLGLLFLVVALFAKAAFESPENGLGMLQLFLDPWLLPLLMAAIVLLGFSRRVRVYESLIQGAREGFDIAIMIIPFLVAILVAVGMFRASGALGLLIHVLQPLTSAVGVPAEVLPMALVRPLSGSGAFGIMTETMQSYGPDSFIGYIVSVLNGSTETTFYVLAVYYGSVRIRAIRHTMAACLCADAAGFAATIALCWIFFA